MTFCPVCGGKLSTNGYLWWCEDGHLFEKAREGFERGVQALKDHMAICPGPPMIIEKLSGPPAQPAQQLAAPTSVEAARETRRCKGCGLTATLSNGAFWCATPDCQNRGPIGGNQISVAARETMTAEQFAKHWPGFVGQHSTVTPGKTLDPLADWQIAVAVRFAEAYLANYWEGER